MTASEPQTVSASQLASASPPASTSEPASESPHLEGRPDAASEGRPPAAPEVLPGPVVDVAWLARNLGAPGLLVLDASVGPYRREVAAVPGARLFDLDGPLSAPDSPLPHTMPEPEQFQRELRGLGLDESSTVVCYDNAGLYSAARCWWMLRAMGFERVAVLDGGLPAWTAAGQPTQDTTPAPAPAGDFTARPRPELIVDSAVVLKALTDPTAVVLDARAADRFSGQAPEPRPGLRGGHMPGAVNVPFTTLQDADGLLLSPDGLRARLDAAVATRASAGDPAVDSSAVGSSSPARPDRLVFSCGSGVTACVLALGATLAGFPELGVELAVYDGSWSEWGLPSDLLVEAG